MSNNKIPDNTSNKLFLFILCCFFLSGFSGLIYEMLWMRMIVKIVGGAPIAVSIILSIFMGGLGLGSYLAGRKIDRIKNPLALVRMYGMLEIAIGAYAIVSPLLLLFVRPLQSILYNTLYHHFIIYNLLTFIICSIILCFPIICMGATLPILCRFYITGLSHVGTHAGRLYGLNTIGAALGTLLCGFWLINHWGVYGTLFFAVFVNFVIGFACLAISFKVKVFPENLAQKAKDSSKKNKPPNKTGKTGNDQPADPMELKSALVIFAVSGFCAMACEVIWTRLLGLIVGPTTYSFTIVLVTFISGLALGGMIFGYFADKVKKSIWLLLFTQIAAALLVLIVSQVLGGSQLFFAKLIYTFQDRFVVLNLLKAGILFLFMILPTLCFGASFPLVGKIYTRSVSKVGKSIGFAYMVNSIGSLAGAFSAGFLIIPLVGKESSIGLIVGLQLVCSIVIAGIMIKNMKTGFLQFGALAIPALAGIILCFSYPQWNHSQLSSGKYHRFSKIKSSFLHTGWLQSLFHGSKILSKSESGELVYYGDGIGGFTTIKKHYDALGNTKFNLANSGKTDASSYGDMNTQTLSAHFPMLFHEDPKTVMVVGLASGITAGEVLHYPVDQLDILEVNNQVVAASNFFIPWNNNVLSDPKTNLIIQDARAHLQLTRQKYDVIISEPSNPWMAGLASLFTADFFDLAEDRLNSGGIFVQWLQMYQMDWETFSLIGRTFSKSFPDSMIITTDPSGKGSDALLIGFKDRGGLELEYAKQKMTSIRKSKNVSLAKPELLYRFIVTEDLQKFFGHGDINTDNHPRLEFAAPKLMYSDDAEISKNMTSKERISLGSETRKITETIAFDVNDQIDFAAYALSVYSPFQNMVDLSKASSSQKEQFFMLMESYCTDNEIDFSIFTHSESELLQKCLLAQIDIIQNKIDVLPDRTVAAYYLGNLYNINGNSDKAIGYYNEVLRSDPSSSVAHNNLGVALRSLGRFDEAITHFSKALQINYDYGMAHYNFGVVLMEMNRFDEAVKHFSEALRINPEHLNAHYKSGLILSKQGKFDEAINHYSIILKIDDGHTDAYNDMGIALARQGRLDEAFNYFSKVIQLDPDHVKAHYNIGLGLAQQGRFDQAIIHFSKALQINPDYLDAHYNLGIVLAKTGRLNDAVTHFLEVLRIQPKHMKTHHSLGLAMEKQGKLAQAIYHFSQTLRLNPNFEIAHKDIGVVLARTGKLEEAAAHFREALRIKPDYIQAKKWLNEVLTVQQKKQ
jgi:spermidine synthase